jgi:hypothetical protein
MTGSQHVTVAVARDPEKAAPVSGSFIGPTTAFRNIQVDVSVIRLDRPVSLAFNQNQSLQNQPMQQAQQMAQPEPASMDMVIQSASPAPVI